MTRYQALVAEAKANVRRLLDKPWLGSCGVVDKAWQHIEERRSRGEQPEAWAIDVARAERKGEIAARERRWPRDSVISHAVCVLVEAYRRSERESCWIVTGELQELGSKLDFETVRSIWRERRDLTPPPQFLGRIDLGVSWPEHRPGCLEARRAFLRRLDAIEERVPREALLEALVQQVAALLVDNRGAQAGLEQLDRVLAEDFGTSEVAGEVPNLLRRLVADRIKRMAQRSVEVMPVGDRSRKFTRTRRRRAARYGGT